MAWAAAFPAARSRQFDPGSSPRHTNPLLVIITALAAATLSLLAAGPAQAATYRDLKPVRFGTCLTPTATARSIYAKPCSTTAAPCGNWQIIIEGFLQQPPVVGDQAAIGQLPQRRRQRAQQLLLHQNLRERGVRPVDVPKENLATKGFSDEPNRYDRRSTRHCRPRQNDTSRSSSRIGGFDRGPQTSPRPDRRST
ncbi:hypothetical protein Ato02nite_074960 [Paractinoplanes toevensis]|uniref:Uncharacterized protein n=1 Tax=Paractinoplanes toevensis TaxID=571911 RepID=A0A919W7P3_9ACTN|nr:hypothetical protein Ato02nite_074960 [Actinoplanes toevensis]